MDKGKTLRLDGSSLTPETLVQAARENWHLELDEAGLNAMAKTNAMVDEAVSAGVPVYGVTTGLGARATELLDTASLSVFSRQTIQGRAHAVGPKLPRETIRAALIVRLNTMLTGHSAANPGIAKHIASCLNSGLTPVCGAIGSIGASDLVLNATIASSLIGEGEMTGPAGEIAPASELMHAHGIETLDLGPRDGLALVNHSSVVAGMAAMAISNANCVFESAQTSAALSMEGFRANLSPLEERVLSLRPLPGVKAAGEGLRRRLSGSHLFDVKQSRRLQDPLSFRNVVQIHGTAKSVIDRAIDCLQIEINSSTDNPVALPDTDEFVSCGNFFSSELTSVLETTSHAMVSMAVAQLARVSKLLNPEFSELPKFLALPESASNGFAPVMKIAESLVAQITHKASPAPVWPSVNANGVEDCLTNTPVAADALDQISQDSMRLTAIEMLVACQAIELRGDVDTLGEFLTQIRDRVRFISPRLEADRPLAEDIESISDSVISGDFLPDFLPDFLKN